MSNQEFNLKLSELKLLQESERKVLYSKFDYSYLAYELELTKLKLLHKKELDDLTKKIAYDDQDSGSELYQLRALHKKELDNFMMKVACTDQKYKLKLNYLKLRHKIELLALKKKNESEISKLEMLHRDELKILMKKIEYNEQIYIPELNQLTLRHSIECDTLIKTFVFTNKLYNIGDVISDNAGSISIRLYSFSTFNNSYEMLYRGIILTKDGEHRKDGANRYISESDVKFHHRQ